jgi:SAM-dependent methyltransferase
LKNRRFDWDLVDPVRSYSPWKKKLKNIIVSGLYCKLIDYAVHCTQISGSHLILKTDLWTEALGMDDLNSIKGDFEVVGVELSKRVCTSSKLVMKGENIIRTSIRDLPFKSEAFSTVVDISTIDHVGYSEATDVVAEYFRILRREGILLLCIDSKLSLLWEIYRKNLNYPTESWMPKYIREIILAHDFDIINKFYANVLVDSFSDIIWQLMGFSTSSRWTFRQNWNKVYSFMAQYYTIVARKKKFS